MSTRWTSLTEISSQRISCLLVKAIPLVSKWLTLDSQRTFQDKRQWKPWVAHHIISHQKYSCSSTISRSTSGLSVLFSTSCSLEKCPSQETPNLKSLVMSSKETSISIMSLSRDIHQKQRSSCSVWSRKTWMRGWRPSKPLPILGSKTASPMINNQSRRPQWTIWRIQ